MRRLAKRTSFALFVATFSLIALSSPALAGKAAEIEAIEEQIKFVQKTQLKPALKAKPKDKDLIQQIRLDIEELKYLKKQVKASLKN